MKTKFLEEIDGLTEDQITAIKDGINGGMAAYVPKEKYNTVKSKLDEVETKVGEMSTKLESAKTEDDIAQIKSEYESQIEEIKTSHQTKLDGITIQDAVTKALADEKAVDASLLVKAADLTGIKVVDGKVVGAEEVVAKLKEAYPTQFGTSKIKTADTKTAQQKSEMIKNLREEMKSASTLVDKKRIEIKIAELSKESA